MLPSFESMAAIARAARVVLPRRTAARTLALARNTEDAEHIAFPREGPGLDYALNWSLNGDGVTPSAQAFRLTKASAAAKLLGKKPAKPSGKGAAARRAASPPRRRGRQKPSPPP